MENILLVFFLLISFLTKQSLGLSFCDYCQCQDSLVDCSGHNVTIFDEGSLSIPDHFRFIDLSDNDLHELRSSLFSSIPHSLNNMDLSSNKFTVINKDTFSLFRNLTVIDLSNNLIQTLKEDAFYNQTLLVELNLSFNKLNHIPKTTFHYLVHLKKLDLSFNKLVTVNEYMLQNLHKLENLDLSFLRLETLHPAFFDWNLTINSLDVSHNLLSHIPTESLWYLRNSLKTLKLSGNYIERIPKDAFMGLENLNSLKIEQWLTLTEIADYAFRDLENLESIVFRYLSRLRKIGKNAFVLSETENTTATYCPIKDFTLEFSTLRTLPKELLVWEDIRYLSLRNNKWQCDCNLIWVRQSDLIRKLTGNTIYCAHPRKNYDRALFKLKVTDMTCTVFTENSKASVGVIALILLFGMIISFVTVAVLFYRRNGWLLRPPRINYDHIETPANTITIYDS